MLTYTAKYDREPCDVTITVYLTEKNDDMIVSDDSEADFVFLKTDFIVDSRFSRDIRSLRSVILSSGIVE